jgi:hypothetical protein
MENIPMAEPKIPMTFPPVPNRALPMHGMLASSGYSNGKVIHSNNYIVDFQRLLEKLFIKTFRTTSFLKYFHKYKK